MNREKLESRKALDSEDRYTPGQRLILAVLACAGTTILAAPLRGVLDLANMVMLFLLTVLLVAVSLGRQAAILASLLSVVLFDVFFVPPHFSLAVSNLQYLITFVVMLATALITTHLAAGLKQKAREAEIREQRTYALYEAAGQLAGALAIEQVASIANTFVHQQFGMAAYLQLCDDLESSCEANASAPKIDPVLVERARETRHAVEEQAGRPKYATLYLPLCAPMRVRGVLALALPEAARKPENIALLEALAALIAIAVERLHYVDVAQRTQLDMVTERLRSSILSALSHDLRTPLTALGGLAESLFLIKPALPQVALDTAQAMHEQALRLAGLVGNLLDMARLNAGRINLRREWQPLEEVIGSSIKLLGAALAEHPVRVALPDDLPLLEFDAVLIERVFCNLLDNAAKYAPVGSTVLITARQVGDFVEIDVCDNGQGFTEHEQEIIFDLFVRGDATAGLSASKPGSGIGLAICRSIVEAHGGTIQVAKTEKRENPSAGHGACIRFTLPAGTPPELEAEIQ
jgi:two-component system sensor histidine kinase KdpD